MSFSQGETGKDSAQMSAAGITGSAEPTPSDGKRELETITISLPALRAIILSVIDDGDPWLRETMDKYWPLFHPYSTVAEDARMRMCDELERRLRQLPARG